MHAENPDRDEGYQVLVNDAGQYSLWRQDQRIPSGWKATDRRGARADCLKYVDEVWADLRPHASPDSGRD